MALRFVPPALLLLAPLACACEVCDHAIMCFTLAGLVAAALALTLEAVHELRLLASLTNIK